MIVTAWYRSEAAGPTFNHISNGYHPDHLDPAPMFEGQRAAWRGAFWIPREAVLENGVVTERDSG
jgi:hypothetical protein